MPETIRKKVIRECRVKKDEINTYNWGKVHKSAEKNWEAEREYHEFREYSPVDFRGLVESREQLANLKERALRER